MGEAVDVGWPQGADGPLGKGERGQPWRAHGLGKSRGTPACRRGGFHTLVGLGRGDGRASLFGRWWSGRWPDGGGGIFAGLAGHRTQGGGRGGEEEDRGVAGEK